MIITCKKGAPQSEIDKILSEFKTKSPDRASHCQGICNQRTCRKLGRMYVKICIFKFKLRSRG